MFANSHEVKEVQHEARDCFGLGPDQLLDIFSEKFPVISAYVEPLPDGLIGDEL